MTRTSKIDKLFYSINYLVITIVFIAVLYPLIYILSSSFSSADAVLSGEVFLWPVDFNLDGYKTIFEHRLIMSGFANSIFYMVVGTFINIVFTIMAAYPLSRKDYRLRNLFMFMITFTIMFNGGMIPNYLLLKSIGILNTRWAMLIPNAIVAWNLIITRTYFQTNIPDELLHASQIDGCNDLKFVWKVVIPLSTPIIGVIGLFYAVSHWNSYFDALIYLKDSNMYPLQIVLREILILNNMDMDMMGDDIETMIMRQNLQQLLKYSLIVVSSVPVLIVYPFIQQYFVKGIMVGAIKG